MYSRSISEIHGLGATHLPSLWVYGKVGNWKRRWLSFDRGLLDKTFNEKPLKWATLEKRIAILCIYMGYREPLLANEDTNAT